MIPILYAAGETQFRTNGIGRLVDCIECTVLEERNGRYECTFRYPITGAHYSDIQEGCIIACIHDDKKDIQPFDIYARTAPIDGVVTFYARHISYRLSNIITKPFTAGTCADAMSKLKSQTINTNPFTFWTDKSVTADYEVKVPSSVKALLGGEEGSILDVYGTGEYKWDGFTVRLYLHRGQDTDVEIRYGKNLVSLTQTYDVSGVYNVVVPYWQDAESGEVVTVDGWTVKGTNSGTGNILVPMDLSAEFEAQPTKEELKAEAQRRLDASKAWNPDENLEVDFVALWQTEEYKDIAPLQRLSLCDTASVFYPELGVSAVKLQVITVEYDVLLERYSRMELGNAKTSFAEVISADTQSIVKQMTKNAVTRSVLNSAIEAATDLITGGAGGYVVINRDANGKPTEILFMDTDNVNTAVHVLRINMNGIGFSSNGINGPYTSAWTIDGSFVADFITTGNLNANLITTGAINADLITTGYLNADRIKAGTIKSDNNNAFWQLSSGVFSNGTGQKIIQLQNGTIYFYNESVSTTENIGFISSDSSYIGMAARYGIRLMRRVASGSSYVNYASFLVRSSAETSSGYSEDAIGLGSWRFTSGVTFASRIITSSGITFKNCYLNEYTTTGTYASEGILTNKDFKVAGGAYMQKAAVGSQTAYIQSGYQFHVAGSAYVVSTMSAQTVTQRSDEHQKNIEEWDDRYTELLDDLEPIVFRWKDSEDKHQHVGLGARHTKKLLEEKGLEDSGFVHVDDTDEHSIVYSELTVMLLKKVQEQQKIIDDLVTRIEALERRVSE